MAKRLNDFWCVYVRSPASPTGLTMVEFAHSFAECQKAVRTHRQREADAQVFAVPSDYCLIPASEVATEGSHV